jgi:hypothetical protein
VRTAVTRADRRRRRHQAALRLWRAAPLGAAACLALAAIGRLAGWPSIVSLSILAAAAAALSVYVFVSGRPRPVSDDIAAAIDADASLGGELRSASWFADRERQDEWIDLHLARAAERLERTDWSELYPPVRAPRARAATAALVLGTVAVALLFPEYTGLRSRADAQTRAAQTDPNQLPEDLQQALEELFAAAEAGTLDEMATRLSTEQMQELLTKLRELRDVDALKDLSHNLNPDVEGVPKEASQEMKELAERLRKMGEINTNIAEFRKSVEELAKNLSDAAAAEEAEMENARKAPANDEAGDVSQTSNANAPNEPVIQSLKESQAAAGANSVVMMSNKDANAAGPPGMGVGGASGSASGEAKPTNIEAALRQETIEASADTKGPNVEAQVRRKTEQGQATSTFTHGAAGQSDRSRAAAPPPVPEQRRSEIQRYFIRKQ